MGAPGRLTRLAATVPALALAIAAVSACDSGGSSVGTTSSAAPAASTGVAPDSSPTTATTTVLVTSTTGDTSISTTSVSSATTAGTVVPVVPTLSAEEAVRSAIALAEESFSACLAAMPTCDPSTLAVARAGPLLQRNMARINEWNSAGYSIRNRNEFRYVIESVTLDEGGMSASAVVCIADGSKLVVPGAGPDGADVIVDDTYISGRSIWEMHLDPDAVWRAHDAPALGPNATSDICPAA